MSDTPQTAIAASGVRRRTDASSTRTEFKDLDKLDIVGIYPNYASAYAAWKAKAQQTVDNAQMRYFIVHLHRLLDPDADRRGPGAERGRSHDARSSKRIAAFAAPSRRRLGVMAAEYLRLVWRTTGSSIEPRRCLRAHRRASCRSSWRCGTASIS